MRTTGSQKDYAAHRRCSEAYISKIKREGKLVVVPGTKLVDFVATDRMLDATSDPDKEGVRERWRYERGEQADSSRAEAGGVVGVGAGAAGDGIDAGDGAVTDSKSRAALDADPDRPELAELSAAALHGGGEGPARGETGAGHGPAAARDPLYEERLQAQVRILRLDEQKKQIELAESAGKLILVSEAQERMHAYGRQIRDMFLAMPARIQADLAAEPDPNAVGRRLNDEIKATLHELTRRVAAEPGADREAGTA